MKQSRLKKKVHEAEETNTLLGQNVLLSPAIERGHGSNFNLERIALFGQFDLKNPLHVTYGLGDEEDGGKKGWHVDLTRANYSVRCGIRAGRPVAIRQELTLSTHKLDEASGNFPRMKATLECGSRGARYRDNFSVEFSPDGTQGWRLLDKELDDPSIKSVLERMPAFMNSVSGSLGLKEEDNWPMGQKQKVGDWLNKHGLSPSEFIEALKTELKHITLPDVTGEIKTP